jgi:hypothetical protein
MQHNHGSECLQNLNHMSTMYDCILYVLVSYPTPYLHSTTVPSRDLISPIAFHCRWSRSLQRLRQQRLDRSIPHRLVQSKITLKVSTQASSKSLSFSTSHLQTKNAIYKKEDSQTHPGLPSAAKLPGSREPHCWESAQHGEYVPQKGPAAHAVQPIYSSFCAM